MAVLVEAALVAQPVTELGELVERRLGRVPHEVDGDVVGGCDLGFGDDPRVAAAGGRDEPLPEGDGRDLELLGKVVELVPLVVGLVLGRIGDLYEREEPDPDALHDAAPARLAIEASASSCSR